MHTYIQKCLYPQEKHSHKHACTKTAHNTNVLKMQGAGIPSRPAGAGSLDQSIQGHHVGLGSGPSGSNQKRPGPGGPKSPWTQWIQGPCRGLGSVAPHTPHAGTGSLDQACCRLDESTVFEVEEISDLGHFERLFRSTVCGPCREIYRLPPLPPTPPDPKVLG